MTDEKQTENAIGPLKRPPNAEDFRAWASAIETLGWNESAKPDLIRLLRSAADGLSQGPMENLRSLLRFDGELHIYASPDGVGIERAVDGVVEELAFENDVPDALARAAEVIRTRTENAEGSLKP